jgi:hypothetical protein
MPKACARGVLGAGAQVVSPSLVLSITSQMAMQTIIEADTTTQEL